MKTIKSPNERKHFSLGFYSALFASKLMLAWA